MTVANDGERTAEGVEIEVTLERDGKEVERGHFAIEFVPRGSTRTGVALFQRDPSCCRIVARAAGYKRP